MKLDRHTPPNLQEISKVTIPQIEKLSLDNGIPLWLINTGSQDLIKIQISIPAGSIYQNTSLTSFFTNRMLMEGSEKYSAAEIAEKLDYYGAFLDTKTTRDNAYINIFCLNKHLENVLEIVADLLSKPSMPQNELDIILQQEKQSFTIQMQKGKILAQRYFNTKIFGEKHPYGRMANIDAYDHIHRDLLLDFHKENYQIANWHILVSGKTTANTIAILNKYFGLMERGDRNSIQPKLTLPSLSESANYFIEQKQAVQTSIKMGKLSIGRQHKDYPILSLTQTILGGYFGSRLMKNIREDKGYTYGINSHISHQAQASVFSIGSDVGSEVANATLDEIKKELSLLSNELVPANELKLVKNYMAGGLLRSLNGPFALGEMMRMIYDHQLPMNYFSQYISSVQAATSEDILKSVRTHLQEDQMISVMAGKQEAN